MENAIIYILSMILCLSGCGQNIPEETPDDVVNEVVSTEEPTQVPTEIATEVPTEPPTEAPTEPLYAVTGKVIVIDAGHGINPSKEKEPNAPGSSVMKTAFATGTRGATQTEEQLNLSVALKLQVALEARGAIVHMTRTTHDTTLSNVGRAQFANNLNADISVKIHADGNDNSSAKGATMLIPKGQYVSADVIAKSREAGQIIIDEYAKATGAKNRGLWERDDMTGFNWSTVPVVLIELGFMTNPTEDALMATEDYQNKMVTGIVSGLEIYFTGK